MIGNSVTKEPNYGGFETYSCGNDMRLGDLISQYEKTQHIVLAFDCYTGRPIVNSGIVESKRLWFAPWIVTKTNQYYHYELDPKHCVLISRR